MTSFAAIYQRAAERKGGEQALQQLLAVELKSREQLAATPDDRYLAAMTRTIFRAGFVWKVVDRKWPGFEAAFWGFDVDRCMGMSPDDEEALCRDERIIRNRQKILTVPHNAVFIDAVRREHGGFGAWLATWPDADFVGLLNELRRHGTRLGGRSGQYFLRLVGRDGFILSRDGVQALVEAGVIDRPPTSQAALNKVQQAYNRWRAESNLSLAQVSRVLAFSTEAPE